MPLAAWYNRRNQTCRCRRSYGKERFRGLLPFYGFDADCRRISKNRIGNNPHGMENRADIPPELRQDSGGNASRRRYARKESEPVYPFRQAKRRKPPRTPQRILCRVKRRGNFRDGKNHRGAQGVILGSFFFT